MSCLLQSFDRPGSSTPVRREKASHDALRLGAHSCCQTLRGMSASGSNLLANRRYSCLRHSRRRSSPFANAASRAICSFWTSGGAPPRTPIPFIRLCRPRANGRKPHADSSAVLTARQSSHASHDHRGIAARRRPEADDAQVVLSGDVATPPTSRGESSSGHDCHRPASADTPGVVVHRSSQPPARNVHGQLGNAFA